MKQKLIFKTKSEISVFLFSSLVLKMRVFVSVFLSSRSARSLTASVEGHVSSSFPPHLPSEVSRTALPPRAPRFITSLLSRMSERRFVQDDDCSSLLSRLGSDSPRPRMKYGGMFCNVEGAFENKTLNFESLSPQTRRCRAARTRTEGRDEAETARGGGGAMVVFPSRHGRENYGRREVEVRSCL